ncbi:hypothetical protein AABB24_019103, partial [Solanum stoloniferum]
CYSLPALGELPFLKFLLIRGMHGITEVTEEKLSVACGGCESLIILYIWGSWKLKWLPERMQELKRITLGVCGEIESFPEGGLPFNLIRIARNWWKTERSGIYRDQT